MDSLDLALPPTWVSGDFDPVEVRRRLLAWLREAIPFDAALFHALSPRVPLETGAFVGVDPRTLRPQDWDALAVGLGRFRDRAEELQGVVSDAEAIPRTGALRTRYTRAIQPFGVHHVVLVHLTVGARLLAVVVLGRRTHPFTTRELEILRRAVGTVAAVDAVAQWVSAAPQASRRGTRCVDDRLTPRQREIASLVAEGFTNREIAAALDLSANTVRNRLADACARLEVSGRAELVARASFR